MRPFVIDCDTGRDDALTLWVAVKASLPLAAVVTSYGNTNIDQVTDNTARVLSLVNADHIPLLVGLTHPERDHRLFKPVVEARQKSCGNGLCNLEFPPSTRALPTHSSAKEMANNLRKIAEELGALEYFIIGPASNFSAIAKELDSDLQKTIASITMMGGKLDPLWAAMPGADFNIASDPMAVDKIMRLGLPMRFVPMNATWPIYATLDELKALRPLTSLAQWAQNLMIAHCVSFAPEPIFRFHDPSVIMAANQTGHFAIKKLNVIIDQNLPDFGRLIENENGIACQLYQTDETTQASFKKSILHWLGFEGY